MFPIGHLIVLLATIPEGFAVFATHLTILAHFPVLGLGLSFPIAVACLVVYR